MANQPGAIETTDVVSAADAIAQRIQLEETAQEPEQETAQAPQEPDEGDEPETEMQDDSSDESEEPETEEPDEETESTSFETVEELAEALDMSLDDFLASIKTKVKINGEEREVTLSDQRAGYQMEQDYRRKTSELAEQRKTFERERYEQNERLGRSLSQVDALLTNAEQELVAEFNSINWNELQEEDPQEYLVKESSFNKRYQKIQAQKQQAAEKANEFNQLRQAEQQKALIEAVEKERVLMMDSIPEWGNEEVRKSEEKAIESYLLSNGFSADEIYMQFDDQGRIKSPGIVDHRVINIIRDAMRYKKQDAKTEIIKKQVKKLPKVVKPGNKVTKKEIKAKEGAKTLNRYKQTGSMDDLGAHIASKLS